jgi:hypothetical protein
MTRSCMLGPQREALVFLYLDGWNGDILCVCLVVQNACPVHWLAVAQWDTSATSICLGLTAQAQLSTPVLIAAIVSCMEVSDTLSCCQSDQFVSWQNMKIFSQFIILELNLFWNTLYCYPTSNEVLSYSVLEVQVFLVHSYLVPT